ncbi:hypothetical protein BCV70DRAFT_17096 [Testicularia cyperi]|uniref:SHSP domain-containing protein n=1 Tax=Testicularia cyperi TaxID=1882483 RepID=A0A317Y1B8_9BASI|nr:hypothetical protein BCV70DRAFT_17096 [Testicularia cyperi]
MPKSFGSQDSHNSISDSTPSISDRSTQTSLSSFSSEPASWAHKSSDPSCPSTSAQRLDSAIPYPADTEGGHFGVFSARREPLRTATIKRSLGKGLATPTSSTASTATVTVVAPDMTSALRPDGSVHITSANLQQHLRHHADLERQQMVAHQQAANYASLAPTSLLSQHNGLPIGSAATDNTVCRSNSLAPPVGGASSSSSSRGSSGRPGYGTNVADMLQVSSQLGGDEMAPRLSISSADSDGTSELATPENVHQAWPYDDVENTYTTSNATPRDSISHVPSKEQIQALESQSESIVAAKEDRAAAALRAAVSDGADIQGTPPSLDRLVLQRPAKLERLSSSATTATAKPQSPTSATASPHTAVEAGPGAGSLDISALRISPTSHGPSIAGPAASAADAGSVTASPSISQSPSRESFSREGMASPDSWRSLLPEHDPYFASEGQLRAASLYRSSSPASSLPIGSHMEPSESHKSTRSNSFAHNDHASISSYGTGRTSFSSVHSAFSAASVSLPGPRLVSQPTSNSGSSPNNLTSPAVGTSAIPPARNYNKATDAWRSLLPDTDRYHVARATGVDETSLDGFNVLQSNHSDSPAVFDSARQGDKQHHRSAFETLHPHGENHGRSQPDYLQDTASRRHASFSNAESSQSTQALSRMLSSRDGHLARPSTASDGTGSTRNSAAPASQNMATVQSQPSFEDPSERESWPTSRQRQPSSSSLPFMGNASSMLSQRVESGASFNQQSVDRINAISPSHVAATSESIVQPMSGGVMAATTRTTTTRTTLTTKLLIPETGGKGSAVSAVSTDADAASVAQSAKPRASSCSVSTPISPPALPFLDHRPAPPETDLVIETEKSMYTLVTRLPGFSLDCITLATKQHKHHRTLHIVADKWDTESGGHFERRITFPEKECDLKNVKAEFDGNVLRVYVPRRTATGSHFSSASSANF